VLEPALLEAVRPELEALRPMKAAFDRRYVKNLDGTHVKSYYTKEDLVAQLRDDIRTFKAQHGCDRLVMVWCGSTEIYHEAGEVHSSLYAFEAGLRHNDPRISPSMLYAYAALREGVPFANGAPNLTVDIPALLELAAETGHAGGRQGFQDRPDADEDDPGSRPASPGVGREGLVFEQHPGQPRRLVLDDPDNFRTKEVSKLGVLEDIFRPEDNPELYGDIYHKVRINYYPPAGDNKESWDNIDIFGWLGYPMQIKIDFLCRDSILAAPIVLDLALFMDLAKRAGMSGIQEWLSFYLKSPQTAEGLKPEHDIFKQLIKLQNTLRHLMGEDLITHLGLDYYQEGVETL
jgi:myo-inositol-1-phosphate synthase